MANKDLSAKFEIVNVKLLLKRMRIVGLPEDVVELVDIWLSTRYNSDIWHVPDFSSALKNHLTSASASALKICTPNYHYLMLYKTLHRINKRAIPEKIYPLPAMHPLHVTIISNY